MQSKLLYKLIQDYIFLNQTSIFVWRLGLSDKNFMEFTVAELEEIKEKYIYMSYYFPDNF